MVTVQELIDGYGPDFLSLEELLGITADEADELRLEMPSPELGRYLKSVLMLKDVTSSKAVSLLRFDVMTKYFISLSDLLTDYKGRFKKKKVVSGLSDDDKTKIRSLVTGLDDIMRAELIEKFSDHDTAAAGDYLKILIGTKLPHLEKMIEGIHFAKTSEDVMGNVFGMVCNKLVYKHIMPSLFDFCDNDLAFVEKY